ncbi:Homeobox-leucine zipper protein HDG4 [Cardamine amara subsp. amara]|uniref:Homeobox-leucine zipper protein HDG4 n=1 Tax=Cardamine amara subsp. amara TaxID=228776 RepID=A0ABD1ABV3_CARAN
MYGDYQVMKSGGEGLNFDNIFGSVSSSPTATFQNPNVKFTSFGNPNFSYIIPKEENEMMSMIEGGSGYDPVEDNAIDLKPPPVKKKRQIYHRHTSHQIQQMEALLNVNPHPDEKQRRRLSKELGLTPLQIKFWFQNRRTLIKAHQDRKENATLKAENDTLKKENHNLHSNLQCLSCSSCRIKLRLENARLRQQLNLLRTSASLMNPPPAQDIVCFFPEINNNDNNMLIAEKEKVIVMDLAVSCVHELVKMCGIDEPLWNKKRLDNESVCLNEEEYKKMFHHNNNGDRFRREASRAKAVVIMNSITLVNTFLDADKWSEMFCSIVSKAKTIQIISSGVSGASGSLLLMYAELQAISPLVPTREAYFLRYVEQNAEEGNWKILDFPIDSFHGSFKPDPDTTADQYRRKPSGCIIQDIPNGYSQVTWIEHVEVEEKHVQHEAVREYVKSGVAFGAERWLAVLQRQCERMASFMATNITDLGVIPSAEAKRNLMMLSQRMVRSFCQNISNYTLSESTKDTLRITTTRKICGGLVTCAVSTTFLPYSHRQVFDLLRDNHQLESLFNGSSFQEVTHIANGPHLGNCISLLQINNVTRNSSHKGELMLQETCIDDSGSLVVYSTVDGGTIQLAMNGEDLSSIPLLPLGFSVVPVNPSESVNSPSCLLTVLVSNVATARENISTVSAINSRIYSTVNRITSALRSSDSSAAERSVVLKQEISW